MRQLSATDAMFLQFEKPHVPFHIGILQIYQPLAGRAAPSLDEILTDLQNRLHVSESFRQKLVTARFGLDFPYWIEDPNFDLEYHVRHVALPRPGTWTQLTTLAARLHARMLDRTRPLWEITVIEGLDGVVDIPAGSFALYFKIHHAAIDGVAGAELLSAIHTTDPEMPKSSVPPAWSPKDPPSVHGLLRAAANNVRRPVRALRTAVPALPSPRAVAKSVIRLPGRSSKEEWEQRRTSIASTRFNGLVTAHRTFDSRACALEDVKRIKNAIPGATVNDVALAVVGGALRSYLEAHREAPNAELVALVPVSTRLPTDEVAGNRISVMMAALGTQIADPRERVARIAEATRAKKERINAVRARALAEAAEVLPGALVGVAMRRLGPRLATRRPIANVMVTNVPGPSEPLYAFGAPMLRLYGLGPITDGFGLAHLVGSYAGVFSFSVAACREMLPDIEFYGDQIDRALDDLRAATGVTAAPLPNMVGVDVPTEKPPVGHHGAAPTEGDVGQ
jgi:diacylglycerol O-acyltransferase